MYVLRKYDSSTTNGRTVTFVYVTSVYVCMYEWNVCICMTCMYVCMYVCICVINGLLSARVQQ